MKHNSLKIVLAAAVILFYSSCDKLKFLANISIDMPFSEEFSVADIDSTNMIPAGGIQYSLPPIAVVTNSSSELKKRNITEEQIHAVSLKYFTEKISNTKNNNFNFVDSLQIYISAAGLPETLMAYQNHISKGADSISFDCAGGDLKKYFLKDTVIMRMQGHFNCIPKAALYKSDFDFVIKANPIKD